MVGKMTIMLPLSLFFVQMGLSPYVFTIVLGKLMTLRWMNMEVSMTSWMVYLKHLETRSLETVHFLKNITHS